MFGTNSPTAESQHMTQKDDAPTSKQDEQPLTDDQLETVAGGIEPATCNYCGDVSPVHAAWCTRPR